MSKKGFVCLFMFLILSACTRGINQNQIGSKTQPSNRIPTVEELSAHYEQYHDYQSLVMLIPHLGLGLTRSDVEFLLGKPSYCPSPNQCYYLSNVYSRLACPYANPEINNNMCISPSGIQVSEEGSPITLIVLYALADTTTSISESGIDKLRSFDLMPTGE